ncbi:MAG: hypothetical protein DMG23_10970 [Acidobacteria bacterium]|nr:MAG: hypothetical protein DMG23_10970 [Acidobacteriota bacterium]
MGTGPKRQAETPKGGHACPFCQVGFLTESRSSNLLYCSGCGQVIPTHHKSPSPLEAPRKALPLGVQIAKLVFDSFRQPLPEGIRNVGPRARQLLYQAGNFSVDLRLDPGPDPASLVGQLMDSTRPDPGIANVPVTLFRSGSRVSKTVTNRLGEFLFEFEDLKHLRLWIETDEEHPIIIDV